MDEQGNFKRRFREKWRRPGGNELVLCTLMAYIVFSAEQQQMFGENIQNITLRRTNITSHNPSQDFNICNFCILFVGGGFCFILINNVLIFTHIRIKDEHKIRNLFFKKLVCFFFESTLIT